MKPSSHLRAFLLLSAGSSVIPTLAFAASADGVPLFEVILPHAFNLILLVLVLGYFALPKVRTAILQKQASYVETAGRAERLLREAEEKKLVIQKRLEDLVRNADRDLERARLEAEQLRSGLLAEAGRHTERLVAEAKKSAELEMRSARESLRQQVFLGALSEAEAKLASQVGETEQRRFQGEFVEKIQVVR